MSQPFLAGEADLPLSRGFVGALSEDEDDRTIRMRASRKDRLATGAPTIQDILSSSLDENGRALWHAASSRQQNRTAVCLSICCHLSSGLHFDPSQCLAGRQYCSCDSTWSKCDRAVGNQLPQGSARPAVASRGLYLFDDQDASPSPRRVREAHRPVSRRAQCVQRNNHAVLRAHDESGRC